MKAAILEKLDAPLVVSDIELPELDFGQVLVKVHYSGICGTQLGEIAGVKGADNYLPHLLGHEGSGVVMETGRGVTTVKPGDHVVMHWRTGTGLQGNPPVYTRNGERVNAGWVTTFQETAVISENRLTTISNDVDMRIAPLFGCAVTTAMGVINNDAKVKIGESVVVFGVGGVGLNLCQAAALVSGNPVVGIDLHDNKLQMARRFGATHTINGSAETDVGAAVRTIVGSDGADVVIDTTGNTRIIEQAYDLTQPDGRTILVGVPRAGDNISIYSLPLHFKKVLKGSHGGDAQPQLDIPRYVNLMNAGKLELDGLITNEFRLDQINEAISLVRSGSAGRVILNMT